jgi:cephalosporin hydroxylase
MDDHSEFLLERRKRIESYSSDGSLQQLARQFLLDSIKANYFHNFDWLGLPIFQYPQDIMALQSIIWSTRPDCIIETGVARGGSVVFYASMLELLGGNGFVVGIDVDTRAHNRKRIMEHPFSKRIRLVDGSSIADATVTDVRKLTKDRRNIMVCLDSNHTHDHVLRELEIYSPMIAPGCYCVVFDTIVEIMGKGYYANRPWDTGNNPKTAIDEFLKCLRDKPRKACDGAILRLEVDQEIDAKLLVSSAIGGYLKRKVTA